MDNNQDDVSVSRSVSQTTTLWGKIETYCNDNYTNRSAFFRMLAEKFFTEKEREPAPLSEDTASVK